MKPNNSWLKAIIASIFIPFILIFVVFTLPVYAFVKRPWDDLKVDYLKEVVSSDLAYFDGDWTGTLKCNSVENSPEFTKYLKFKIKMVEVDIKVRKPTVSKLDIDTGN